MHRLTLSRQATLQILFFFFIAVFAFHPERYVRANTTRPEEWPAYFHMPVIFLILITVINDGTLIAVGYDNATPSAYPDRWILPILFLSAAVLSGIACLSSLLFLHVMLDSWNPHGLFQHWGTRAPLRLSATEVLTARQASADSSTVRSSTRCSCSSPSLPC